MQLLGVEDRSACSPSKLITAPLQPQIHVFRSLCRLYDEITYRYLKFLHTYESQLFLHKSNSPQSSGALQSQLKFS